ncbi:hypothetical protein [Pantoea ananatis]|uniref:hypothetical protein n=1 Tax=Pantoea ananas TaxID=553 RepID=UPI001FAF26CE|nr:hypothetical protein [Pantoea ananatis]
MALHVRRARHHLHGFHDVSKNTVFTAHRLSHQQRINHFLLRRLTRAASELFNALGASDTRVSKALDRHWRNARTIGSHNPVIYKSRNVGDWEVNGRDPTFIWQIGSGE